MEQRQVQTEYVNQGKTVVGYAAVFNSPARVFERGKAFTETIAPGAFRNALASGGDIISTFNHDNNRFLGRTSNKTLRTQRRRTRSEVRTRPARHRDRQ